MNQVNRTIVMALLIVLGCMVACSPAVEKPDDAWVVFKNEVHGYSFDIPVNCSIGPMPSDCKQNPPEQRPDECLCFLNAENPNEVFFQSFLGEGNRTLAGISVFHFNTPLYHPPANTELTVWLQQNFSGRLEGIPEAANTEIGGIPAVKIVSPASPMAPAYEEIYFLKDENLYCVQMMAVDESVNRQLYDQVLSSFRFEE